MIAFPSGEGFLLLSKLFSKKVLTYALSKCIIIQVADRQHRKELLKRRYLGKTSKKNKKVLDKMMMMRYDIEADSQEPLEGSDSEEAKLFLEN